MIQPVVCPHCGNTLEVGLGYLKTCLQYKEERLVTCTVCGGRFWWKNNAEGAEDYEPGDHPGRA